MDTFEDISPIFVVGAPRSGTTMLQLMLNSHPAISVCGELHFFDEILQIKKYIPSLNSDNDLDQFFKIVVNAYSLRYIPNINALLDGVQDRMKKESRRSYQLFHRYMLEEFSKQEGSIYFGEKTPSYVRYMEDLVAIYPRAYIIHIIRDPRAVIASMINAPFMSNDILINSIKWKLDIVYSQEFKKQHFENYKEIRYEDLVENPQEILRNICQFVGIEYNENMLTFHHTSENYLHDEPWKNGARSAVNTNSTRKWEKQFSATQIFIIQRLLKSLMKAFDYDQVHIRFVDKLLSPVVLFFEVAKYIQYKLIEERKRKTENSNAITGNTSRLFEILLGNLIKRRKKERTDGGGRTEI